MSIAKVVIAKTVSICLKMNKNWNKFTKKQNQNQGYLFNRKLYRLKMDRFLMLLVADVVRFFVIKGIATVLIIKLVVLVYVSASSVIMTKFNLIMRFKQRWRNWLKGKRLKTVKYRELLKFRKNKKV